MDSSQATCERWGGGGLAHFTGAKFLPEILLLLKHKIV